MRQLEEQEWPEVYRMMREQEFPAVPGTFEEAWPFFKTCQLYGWPDDSQAALQVALIFGAPDNGLAFLDVVCAPGEQGRWARPGRLRALYRLAFNGAPQGMGLRGLWVQPYGERALRACTQAGFRPMVRPNPPMDGEAPILLMTPHSQPPRYCLESN